jgi:hypothetical protein
MADAYTAVQMIQAKLSAGWTATSSARLRFENEAFIDMTTLAAFCQVEIVCGEDKPYVGERFKRLNRVDGLIYLHMMTPVQDGTAAIRTMHANARATLAHQAWRSLPPVGEIEWEDPNFWNWYDACAVYTQGISPNRGRPASEDGSYFGVTSVIPFFSIYRDPAS